MPNRGKWLGITILIGAVLALAGCSPNPQSTLAPVADNSRMIFDLTNIIFWAAVAVFVLVEGVLVYSVIRFRQRKGDQLPVQLHGNTPLEITWTVIPAVMLVVIFVLTIQTLNALAAPPPAATATNSLHIMATGHQWWWEFRIPDQNVVTANELHVPVGTKVIVDLQSADVIHSFWVPKLFGKTDMIPGHTNQISFAAEQPGEYWGQCVEFCGQQHGRMRFKVFVQSQADYEAWLASVKAVPAAASGTASAGAELFSRSACIGCHTIAGTNAAGVIGPNLTHVGSRTTLAAGTLDNTPQNMAAWIRNPQAVKPGNLMPNLGLQEQDINALVTYLESLK